MSSARTNAFSLRGFTSVLAMGSSIVLATTGVILFFLPPGRIANWTDWTLLGLSKSQWQTLHTWFALTFLLTAIVHIWLNWRPLLVYFKRRIDAGSRRRFGFRWDWAAPGLLCLGVAWGAVAGVPPFSSLMALGEQFKQRYERTEARAPVPHAESLTLSALAQQAGLDLEEMKARLVEKGIDVSSEGTVVGEMAEKAGISPDRLFRIAAGEGQGGPGRGHGARGGSQGWGQGSQGAGMGRKTLGELCAEEGLATETAIERLQASGIEAGPEATLRDIADSNGVMPYEVLDVVTGGETL